MKKITEVVKSEIFEYNSKKNEGKLGKFKAVSFIPDGVSRNGRFYPKKLWENVLENKETKEMLENNRMLGCIGHPENYTIDKLMEDGRISHIVKNMYIENGKGIAEYEILDTPSGRILDTLLKAGVKLNVSTRAFGSYANEVREINGQKLRVLDPNNFKLESIDVVYNPGIAQAAITLYTTEEFEKENIQININESEENNFSNIAELKQLLEHLDNMNLDKGSKKIIKENVELLLQNGKICKKNFCITHKDNIKEDIKKDKEKSELEILKILKTENEFLNKKIDELYKLFEDEKTEQYNVKLLVAYIEVLTKLLKYNEKYEKEYVNLIEVLDKNDKLEDNDISIIKSICKKILKDKEIDESIQRIVDLILKLLEPEKEDKDKNKDKENDQYVKLSDFITQTIEHFIRVKEDLDKIIEENISNKKIIERTQKAYKSIIEKLEEVENNLSLKENEILELKEEISKNEQIISEKEKLIEKMKEVQESILNEKEILESKVQTLEEQLQNLNEELNKFDDSIFENYQTKINELEIQNKKLEMQNKKAEDTIEKLTDEINGYRNLFEIYDSYIIKYFVFRYAVSESKVKEILESVDTIEQAESLIKEIKKTKPIQIESQIQFKEEKKQPKLFEKLVK